jgi:hypothetical protein
MRPVVVQAHGHGGGTEGVRGSEDILRAVDKLPSDAAVEREFDLESTARSYANALRARIDRTKGATLLLNLGDPAARRGVTDFVSRLIKANRIGCYRQDFNMEPLAHWRAADAPEYT